MAASSSPIAARELATGIVRRLVAAGHEAYFCGGCVRDQAMGVVPKDYDVATSATPEAVQALFRRTHAVGAKFGVVLVVEDDQPFEVATFRSESGYSDGRRPDAVRFTSAVEDVRRRDFTINGLLYDPLADRMLDHVGGLEDIRRRILRTIGDPGERFAEDHLRLMRAVRFASRLGFEIESSTWAAIREEAGLVRTVAAERVRDELASILTGPRPGLGMRLLEDSGLLGHVLPEFAALAEPARREALAVLEALGPGGVPLELGLAALLSPLGPGGAEAVGRRLAMPVRRIQAVVDLVEARDRFEAAPCARLADVKRLLALDAVDDHLRFLAASLEARGRSLEPHAWCLRRLEELRAEPDRLRPPRLLWGEDVLGLGVPRGPSIGRILEAVEDAQLEESVRNREEALDLARRLAADDPGGSPP